MLALCCIIGFLEVRVLFKNESTFHFKMVVMSYLPSSLTSLLPLHHFCTHFDQSVFGFARRKVVQSARCIIDVLLRQLPGLLNSVTSRHQLSSLKVVFRQ